MSLHPKDAVTWKLTGPSSTALQKKAANQEFINFQATILVWLTAPPVLACVTPHIAATILSPVPVTRIGKPLTQLLPAGELFPLLSASLICKAPPASGFERI